MIGKLKKDSAPYTHHCSGEGREKREGKSLCGGNHITSLLYLREERKEVLTHSCKGILHLHTYGSSDFYASFGVNGVDRAINSVGAIRCVRCPAFFHTKKVFQANVCT